MSYVQEGSPILIATPLGADRLLVKRLRGEERICGLYHCHLELISEDHSIDFTSLVGKAAAVTLPLAGGGETYIHGIVGRFVQGGRDKRFTTYFAELHPWLWLTTMNQDCRIFQNLSVPDIVQKVFTELGFTDFKNELTATYAARDYCVQYMETSFDFVSRLMEEEGIFYFFTHTGEAHTLVLADGPPAYRDLPGGGKIAMRPFDSTRLQENSIDDCTLEQQVTVGQYQADDYNFEMPATDLYSMAEAQDTARSVYEYPGGFAKKADGERISRMRLESYEAAEKALRGTSPCRSFRPGCKFTLEGHARQDANGEYVLTSVSYHADQSAEYSTSFEALPAAAAYRPVRTTPRPRIYGTQTATVVGKTGEEIWTDQYGRVKLKFHWDRTEANDETASCWVRVAQGWAGKGWGAMLLPRVGQEVVVTFLEGDPDRPLVVGAVYNAAQTVPYTLPGEQTRSTLKSNSSKGGGGFNEIRFEDKKGSEEVFIQAQKDMNVSVLNDLGVTVNNDRTVKVTHNDSLTVAGDKRSIAVTQGDEEHQVKGKRDVTVTGAETHTNQSDYSAKVTGNFTLKVSGSITIEATQGVTIKAGTGLKIEAGTSIESSAGTSLTNKAGTTMENNAAISLTNKAGASQTVDGGGMLTLKGGLVKIN